MKKIIEFLVIACFFMLVTASSYAAFFSSKDIRGSQVVDTAMGETLLSASMIDNSLSQGFIQTHRSISEPTAMFLLGTGLFGIAGLSRKKMLKRG